MGLHSMTSPKTLINTNELQGVMPLTPHQQRAETESYGMIQVENE